MIVKETHLGGCFIIEPTVIKDERGYFMEAFNLAKFCEVIGSEVQFVQDNESFSRKGVVRAFHRQLGAHAQAKLVRVLSGSVLDVAIDLREDSHTFGQYVVVELSCKNKKQLYIPKGFAHGFLALSDTVNFFYKCDNYYNKSSEQGIIYNDPTLNIDWNFPENEMILSDKDQKLPTFKELFS